MFEIPPQCIGGEFQHGYSKAQSSPCKHKNKNVLMFQDQPFQRRSALPREYQSGTIKCRSAPIGANYFIECAAAKRLTMGAALPIGHQTLDFSDTSRTSHRWTDAWHPSEIRWSMILKNIGLKYGLPALINALLKYKKFICR